MIKFIYSRFSLSDSLLHQNLFEHFLDSHPIPGEPEKVPTFEDS